MNEVVKPYTRSRPAALILDDYSAHWSPCVQAAAVALNLTLIHVPNFAGATALLQPLDVEFNGPMSIQRKKLWTQIKLRDPDSKDSEQACVERVQLAYEAMSKAGAVTAFRKAKIIT